MSGKLVVLTAHRNTLERRRNKELVRQIREDANQMQQGFKGKTVGFVLVAWNGSGDTFMTYSGAKKLGVCPLSEFAKQTILKHEVADATLAHVFPPPPDEPA